METDNEPVRYLGKEQRNLGEARMHSIGASLHNPVKHFISVAYF